MINVTIFNDSNGVIRGFRVSGHAGFAKKGSDVVCAAASMLAINTVNSIERLTGEAINDVSDEKKGLIECVFPDRKNGTVNNETDLLIKSMIIGFDTLAEQFRDYVRIEEASYD